MTASGFEPVAGRDARVLSRHPDIQLIGFNGAKAATLFRPVVPTLDAAWASTERVVLPSTSPAHASMSRERKSQIWRNVVEAGLE